VASSSAPVKRRPGRPVGSKNKPKLAPAAPGPSAPPANASSPRIYSFFCIAGAGEQFFKVGWSDFAEDHDLRQGFFMTFDFHIGTSKFDVRIYDGTQCQKEYEAEVHFH
jgi:hypothetical protein